MTNFKPFLSAIILVQSALLVLLPTSFASSGDELFLQCLDSHSDPLHPASQVTYAKHNSSFESILRAYARNIRFLQPDIRKPSFIVTPKHVSNIAATIHCCQTHAFEMRIRGGGHDMEGLSYTSTVPFVILDMFNLRAINVNVKEETAWIEAGAQLGEVYYKIAEKSPVHGFPGGVCPTVGVAGHFTGGGYGNLVRKYGLSSDNIIDILLVNANGTVLDRKAMGEDLFWALRGGGAASFGVVYSFKVSLVRVPPTVTVFQVARPLEKNASNTLYRWQEVAPNLPKELFLRARVSVIQDQNGGQNKLAITFISLFLGESRVLVDMLAKSFPELELSATECQEMPWIKSTLFWDGIPTENSNEVLLSREYQKLSRKVKSDYATKPIPRAGLELMLKELLEMHGLVMEWNPYGGRMNEISADETAFPHRAGNLFKIEYDFKWHVEGKEVEQRHIGYSRRLYKFMTPYVSMSPREAFFNYRDLDLGTNPGGSASFGEKYYENNFRRLMKVKIEADPLNFFRNEQSIPPYSNLK